jgi:hypothetical protein
MPEAERKGSRSVLRGAVASVGLAIAWLLRQPLRLLALPFNRELAKLRGQIRAYGEGSIEATSTVGTELRSISATLEEELPELRKRIEAIERELAASPDHEPPESS